MIDKRKNVCYVIHVNYWYRKGGIHEIRQQKFISQHQIGTKRFDAFLKNYFNGFPGFDGYHNDDLASQWTVGWESWPGAKEEVLEGITEKEKCY